MVTTSRLLATRVQTRAGGACELADWRAVVAMSKSAVPKTMTKAKTMLVGR